MDQIKEESRGVRTKIGRIREKIREFGDGGEEDEQWGKKLDELEAAMVEKADGRVAEVERMKERMEKYLCGREGGSKKGGTEPGEVFNTFLMAAQLFDKAKAVIGGGEGGGREGRINV